MAREPLRPALPRNFLRPCILLLLREEPAHGYEVIQRLRPFGYLGTDPGRVYRALRTLESEGLVRSVWERSHGGPDRRMYELSRKGLEELHRSARAIAEANEIFEGFLSRYGEFVAIGRPDAGRS